MHPKEQNKPRLMLLFTGAGLGKLASGDSSKSSQRGRINLYRNHASCQIILCVSEQFLGDSLRGKQDLQPVVFGPTFAATTNSIPKGPLYDTNLEAKGQSPARTFSINVE